MSKCTRCGMGIPQNGIHLFRGGEVRRLLVQSLFPNSEVSQCEQPPPASFWEPIRGLESKVGET